MAKQEKWKFDRATVIYDVDGVAVDDITLRLKRGFPPEGHGAIRRACAEGLFNILRLKPFRNAALKKMVDEAKNLNELKLDEHAAAHMRRTAADGVGVAICTSNPFLYSSGMGRLLCDHGIKGAHIKIALNGSKADLIPKEGTVMIEDDPMVALVLAREGVEAIVLKKDYNPLLARLFEAINGNLHVARDWEDADRIAAPLITGKKKEMARLQPH